MALTDTAIRNAKPKEKPYKVTDAQGLYLLVNPRGSKLWRVKYRMNGVDHVIIHADSKATNLVDQKSFYVGISRAKDSVAIFTNDRAKLVSAIGERAGQMQTAMLQAAMPTPAAGKELGVALG